MSHDSETERGEDPTALTADGIRALVRQEVASAIRDALASPAGSSAVTDPPASSSSGEWGGGGGGGGGEKCGFGD